MLRLSKRTIGTWMTLFFITKKLPQMHKDETNPALAIKGGAEELQARLDRTGFTTCDRLKDALVKLQNVRIQVIAQQVAAHRATTGAQAAAKKRKDGEAGDDNPGAELGQKRHRRKP